MRRAARVEGGLAWSGFRGHRGGSRQSAVMLNERLRDFKAEPALADERVSIRGSPILQCTDKARIADVPTEKKYFAEVGLCFSMETIGVMDGKFSTGTRCSANLD